MRRKKNTPAIIIIGTFIIIIIIFTIIGINSRQTQQKDSITGDNTSGNFQNESRTDGYTTSKKINNFVLNTYNNWSVIFDIFSLNLKKYNDLTYELYEKTDTVRMKKRFRPVFRYGNINGILTEYGDFIKERCNFYNIDWRLILAIIHQESFFDSMAVSRAGAFGLMQIMPRTGMGLQSQLNLEDTRTAKNNLIAGIHYYANLVATFEPFGEDKYKFALASYNAGLARMVDVMTIAAYYGKDYKKWDEVKEYFPMLSSKYDSVQRLVWPDRGRPSGGILNNWREPYYYVEYVSFYFEEYKKLLEPNLPEQTKKYTKRKHRKR